MIKLFYSILGYGYKEGKMNIPSTSSSLDVAYWFLNRAEKDGIYLETDKLQHLLFVAQNKYASSHHHAMLMPCVFLCDEQGFFEPTLKRIFAQGIPFMPPIHLEDSLTAFLEQVWKELSPLSLAQCKRLVTKLPVYSSCYQKGQNSVVLWDALIKNLSSNEPVVKNETQNSFRKKVLVSQNGPVIVSQWTPRKINQ